MSESLARKTIAEIEHAIADEKTTAITEIIQLIQQLAAKAFSISIEELSQLIGRDPTITEKVISSANTLGFNPMGIAVATISDAIHTVGFEKIRNLAISLMLAENAGEGANTYEQRNVAALCVCSGMLAQQLDQQPESSLNSDLLFVCASLRSYGRLLLSTFLIDNYRLARSHALDMPEDLAFEKVFGLTPLKLGQKILSQTNLPKSIMYSLRAVTKETISRPPETTEDEILLLSDLSIGLCSVVFDETISPDAFNDALADVLSRFSRSYPLSIETVNEALIKVEEDISTLNRAVRLDEKDSPASSNLIARLSGSDLPEPPPYARISAQLKQKSVGEMNEDERKTFSDATFAQAVESISLCLQSGSKVKLETVFMSVCIAFKEAVNLENCLAFVREEFDPHCLSARYGIGDLFAKVKNRPLLAPDKKDIFSICLARKEDILIQDTNAGKIRSVIPDWIHAAGDTSSLIILPVNHDGRLYSIIAGTVSHERHIDLNESDLKHLRYIRAMISDLYGKIESQDITAI
ncbi:HDOD domain family [Verrucomicrobiia bacterium DG1235]|nr:HDOD domain family [Verrucomicrobiae bacterium DG1235]